MSMPSDRDYGPLREHPDVIRMDALTRRWEYAALTEQLARSLTIVQLNQVPADALLQLDVQSTDGSLAVQRLRFRKSPAPAMCEAESEWLQIGDNDIVRPVVLHGACLGDGLVSEPGSIKAGAAFGFYSVNTFRSRPETVVDGQTLSALPEPETIDPFILSVCRGMGMVSEDMTGQLLWRLPATYFQTGVVLDAAWSQPGARAGDAAEN